MNHLKDFTPYHINNLDTIVKFLDSGDIPPPKFNITDYLSVEGDPWIIVTADEFQDKSGPRASTDWAIESVYNSCGSTACAVGHGPLAGIPALPGEYWREYSLRVFGCSQNINIDAFDFMFGHRWRGMNNTAKGTAARIRWFLKNGILGYPDNRQDIEEYYRTGPWLETETT